MAVVIFAVVDNFVDMVVLDVIFMAVEVVVVVVVVVVIVV